MSVKDGLKRAGAVGLAGLAAAAGGVAKMPQAEEMMGIESPPAIHQTLRDYYENSPKELVNSFEDWIQGLAEKITATREQRESNSVETFNRNSGTAAGSTGGSEGEDDE